MTKNESTITQRRNHGDHLAMLQHRQPSRIFKKKNSYCVFGGISLVSCIMSCSNRTRSLLGLSTEHNWWDWAEHSRINAPTTTPGMTKLFSCMIMQDNARPHVAAPVKTYLETLKWEVLPHPPYSPDIAPSDYHLFRSMTHDCLSSTSHHISKNCIDDWIESKDEAFFRRGIHMLSGRWEKIVASNSHYFE